MTLGSWPFKFQYAQESPGAPTKMHSLWHPQRFSFCETGVEPRNGPFSQLPGCRCSLGQGVGGREAILQEGRLPRELGGPLLLSREGGRPMLVLVSFVTFSIWETKQVPPRDKGLVLET